ncbi:hypothetical protein ES703_05072 [subsurface metagenome]
MIAPIGKAQLPEGDSELRRPAIVLNGRLAFPDSVPVHIHVFIIIAADIPLYSLGIEPEFESRTVVIVTVKGDVHPIAGRFLVPSAEYTADILRSRIIGFYTDVNILVVIKDCEFGPLSGGLSFKWITLDKISGKIHFLPGLLAQVSINTNVFGYNTEGIE